MYAISRRPSPGIGRKGVSMIKKSAISLILFMAVAFPLLAQEQDAARQKIIIFQFRDTSRTTDYGYYSYIIPDSIALELRRKETFNVHTYPVTLDYVGERDTEAKRKDHLLYLSGRSREFGADYIISGIYEVKDNRINIKSQIYGASQQKIMAVNESSEEMGALIFLIIDSLTQKINTQLGGSTAAIAQQGKVPEKKVEETPPETKKIDEGPPAKSPFLAAYNVLHGAVIGAEHGKLYFAGDWGGIYQDTEHYSFHLRYGLGALGGLKNTPVIKDSSITLNYHYLASQADNMSSSLMVRGATAGYAYSLPVYGNFRVSAEGGLGLMFSTLRVYDPLAKDDGPQSVLSEQESMDPFTRLILTADYELEPLVIRTGFSMNRIWYSDVAMDFLSLVFSLGFRI